MVCKNIFWSVTDSRSRRILSSVLGSLPSTSFNSMNSIYYILSRKILRDIFHNSRVLTAITKINPLSNTFCKISKIYTPPESFSPEWRRFVSVSFSFKRALFFSFRMSHRLIFRLFSHRFNFSLLR